MHSVWIRRGTATLLVAGVMVCGRWAWISTSARAAEASLMAAAMATITPDDLTQHVQTLADDTFEGREAGSRGGHAAAGYLVERLKKLNVSPGGDGGTFFQAFGNQYRNILAIVPGSDPELKDQIVVVGAHYDHVGYGTARNSLGPIGYIHNGADDNASGTAGVLEVIEAISIAGLKPRRTILFALWDGEEMGLLGSKHWVQHPTVALDKVVFAINIDMIGRLRQERITVYGTRTAEGLRRRITDDNRFTNLLIDFDWEMKADSDHYTFFEKRIPIVMLHTGLHDDYHRPSDDTDKINFTGLAESSQLLLALVEDVADAPTLPGFRRDAAKEAKRDKEALERPMPPATPRLGVTWNDRDKLGPGVMVQRVDARSSAQRGGLRAGDRIISFDGREVKNGDELRQWIVVAPETVKLGVLHAGDQEPVELDVELVGKPLRLGISWREDKAEPGSVLVVRVVPGSRAHAAGIHIRDRIEKINGQSIGNGTGFQTIIASLTGPYELLVERDGRHETVRVP